MSFATSSEPVPPYSPYLQDLKDHSFASVVDLAKRHRDIADCCAIAWRFFTGLPGTDPIVALVLDDEEIILEAIIPRAGLSTKEQMKVRPGLKFPVGYENQDPHYIEQQRSGVGIAQELQKHVLQPAWQAGVTTIYHPMLSRRPTRIVLMTKLEVPAEVLMQMLTMAAYAIYQLWLTTVAHQNFQRNDIEQTTEFLALEHKLQDYDKFSSLASLSAGIAHEIRNPLTTARGFLQLFEQRCAPADKAYLQLTIRELDRIQLLLGDFMGMSRPDDEAVQTVDIGALIESVCEFLNPEASLRSVELLREIPDRPAHLRLQPGRIKQVLINLVKNAIHACEKHGDRVCVLLREQNSQVVVSIADTGCGISDVSRLFHPFHTTKPDGTGLGLFVSKHIIEDHGGHIQVESTPDVGTTVTVVLPKRD